MATQVSPLVLTKLRVPASRPRGLPRTRLLQQLDLDTAPGLVLVCAPAGYGKTTLLVEWSHALQQAGVAVAWYALDPSDDAPLPFGAYLVASLESALGQNPELERISQILRASPEVELHRLLPPLINAVFSTERECVLVLDDYHLISSPAVHSALAYLVERLPENLHIAIGSRSDPPLPLARWRVGGQLLELRAANLRFSRDEAAAYLNDVMRLGLSPETVSTLEARTEGWIAGLQLAALSLAGSEGKENFLDSFTGSHRYLVDYLLEEVVSRQPEHVRSFLLHTSVLERMTASLCDHISDGTGQSEAILQQLEQANLFVVALDDQGQWFRYHHLFRDFLLARLQKLQPERTTALHRAASDWYGAHHSLREAAQHAFLSGDWEYAARFVEQHSFSMIVHGEIAALYEWCSAFPEEVMHRHPLLRILQCWSLVFRFRRQARGKIEARLEQAERAAAALQDPERYQELMEHAAIVRSFLAMAPDPHADPRQHLALAERLIHLHPDSDPGQFSALITFGYAHMALHNAPAAVEAMEKARQVALEGGLYFGVIESTFHLAHLAIARGRLQQAVDLCRQSRADLAAALDNPEQELPAVGSLDIALGCALLEQDRPAEAEQFLRHGLELYEWGMNPYYLMAAYLAMYRLRRRQNYADAAEYLDRLEQAWPDIEFCTQGLRVVQALRTTPEGAPERQNLLAGAQAWCEAFTAMVGETVALAGMGPLGAAEAYYLAQLAWLEAQVACGEVGLALASLEEHLALAEANGLTRRVVELSLLEIQARQAAGDSAGAWVALERALAAAPADGFAGLFDRGPGLTRLLVEAAGRGVFRPKIARILSTLGLSGEPASILETAGLPGSLGRSYAGTIPGSGERLSERELALLGLIAQGASNQEIAQQMVITVGTVKSHVNHILRKLGARNRTEAVARARSLGLIET